MRAAMIRAVPSRRALWLLALASPLLAVSVPVALLVDLVIGGLILLDARRTQAPEARRRASEVASLGTFGEVVVTVANPTPRAVRVMFTDDIDARFERRGARRSDDDWNAGVRLAVPPGGSVSRSYRMRPRARGFLELGDMHLRALGPLGLAWTRVTVPATDVVRVQPGIRDFLRDRKHSLRRPLHEMGPRRTRMRAEGTEFESLREYVKGDDPRTIDWKASARRRHFLVRNYQAERGQHLVLAIDAGRHMRETILDRERADIALAASMLLASRAQAYGDRLGVMVFDDRIRHLSAPRRVNLPRLAETLTGVETRLVEPNYPLAMATLGRTFSKRSLVVLFSDVIDETVSRALVRSLGRIARAHLPLAVTIGNPGLEKAAGQVVGTDGDAFRRAAAAELVQARALALQAMRRSGILVVDVPPAETLAATLDKYMEVKERGLL
ncbi:MAG: DUF58 domain-containing protein [Gammaproteobacteria bacterium]|nr:DUF58 domain-containing protein [Gammaproteobacteria bacterium]